MNDEPDEEGVEFAIVCNDKTKIWLSKKFTLMAWGYLFITAVEAFFALYLCEPGCWKNMWTILTGYNACFAMRYYSLAQDGLMAPIYWFMSRKKS